MSSALIGNEDCRAKLGLSADGDVGVSGFWLSELPDESLESSSLGADNEPELLLLCSVDLELD